MTNELDITEIRAGRPSEITIDGITIAIRWNSTWTRPVDGNTSSVHHGDCALLPNIGGVPAVDDDVTIGERWARTWRGRPAWIQGIGDDELEAALAELLDVGRAARAQEEIATARRGRAIHVLRTLRGRVEAAWLEPAGHQRANAVKAAQELLHRAVASQIRVRDLYPDEIIEHAGITEHTYRDQEAESDRAERYWDSMEYMGIARPPVDPSEYVGYAEIAALLRVTVETVRSYKSRGYLPAADLPNNGRPLWHPATIALWRETRSGQGAGGGRPTNA